ncbi:hypothetical protein V8C86DRAFT_129914 [Haematococcus lacustris]
MHHNNSFVKKTKKGKVVKVVREHYLRDDIWSGTPLDPEAAPESHRLSSSASHYLVIDTNVALHQIDFLEHPAVTDVIVCSVVLEEVRHKNSAAYTRLRALTAPAQAHKRFYVFANEHHRETFIKAEPGESPNDRNDRAIRIATKWYADRLQGKMRVLMLSNDAASRRKAVEEGVEALGVAAYVSSLRTDVPELLDLVAAAVAGAAGEGGDEESMAAGLGPGSASLAAAGGGPRGAKRKRLYPDHKTLAEVAAGLKAGTLHQGTLCVGRFNPFEGSVSSSSAGLDILVSGRLDMNRAMDGDVVAVELLPEAEWRGASTRLPTGVAAGGDGMPQGEGGDSEEEGEAEREGRELGPLEVFQVAPGEHFDDGPVITADAISGSGKKQPTGRIVGIVKRNWRSRGYCGSLQPPKLGQRANNRSGYTLFLPVERRYPAIRIQTRQAESLMDKRLVVVIDGWEPDSPYPAGHYVRTLGVIGDKETETEVLLIEHDINTSPFTPAVHDCVPPLPWRVGPEHESDPNRTDLRSLCICSVDPPGCKDIDDALHVRPLPNGNYEVGVHIADVTHFLRPGTAMDLEAMQRATTTYLVQRRIDMLPKPLTEDICSLRGGEERLTFSVLWEMSPDASILSTAFTKALIRSRAALTYADAQDIIDFPTKQLEALSDNVKGIMADPPLAQQLTDSLRAMNGLAKLLRRRRSERGALQLASPEVKFKIDSATQEATDVGMYQVLDTNHMVEELMLLANVAVAEKVARHFPSCSLLRRHPTPPPRQFEPILKAAAAVGLTLDVSSSKALAESLDAAVRAEDAYFNKLVRIMSTRCMTQAVYFCSGEQAVAEYHHYGLASPIYTHFTSPIRRYADVVVHRLLAASLQLEPLPDSARDRAALRACAENLNTRHHNAQLAGRSSVELHTLLFFNGRTVLADARVTKVKSNGLVVFVPKFGIEGPLYLTARSATDANNSAGAVAAAARSGKAAVEPEYVLDDEKQTVTARDGSMQFRVFDPCAVRISVQEGVAHRRSLLLELVPRDQLPPTERV